MTKLEMTEEILAAKRSKKENWSTIAAVVGLSEIYVTSACLGQNTLNQEEAEKIGKYLELSKEAVSSLQVFADRGPGQVISSDPLIYRFFEICFVYGPTLKQVIQEKFGEGIMSAIDFTMDVDKIEDPKGDRVKVTMNGKFLSYKKW